MHKTAAETKEHLLRLRPLVFRTHVEVGLAVPFTSIAIAAELAQGSAIEIGAQNMSDLLAGALTGEVSALMIREAGASFVILGHSERRQFFHEDDVLINRKLKLALRMGLKVILCVGETEAQHQAQETEKIITQQLKKGLEQIASDQLQNVIIAYEPVWAIGSKQPATPEIVEKIHLLCKTYVANDWLVPIEGIRLLYGGSVNPHNAKTFLELTHVDGLLVGGASLDVQSFVEIIHHAEDVQ